MNNDKEVNQKRVSKINKGIQRTLTTAKYESIVIFSHIEEEIEWTDIEERERKSRNWDTFLIEDFKQTHDSVLEELGLCEKKAYFRNALDTDDRPEPETSLENLDSLD